MAPEGWKISHLGEVANVIDCKHRTPPYVEHGVPVISPGVISWGALDTLTPTKRVSKAEHESLMDHCQIRSGDLVMGRNQSVGVAAYVGSDTEFVLGQDTVLIQPSAALNNKYAFYAMQSAFVQRQIFKLSGGSTFSRINLAEIRKLKIPVTEQSLQKKIAQTLSTWDKAIDTVERLIENSKTQKKALMQKLLLGSERLPGYDDEWNVRHLEDIAIIAVSPVDKKSSPGENTVRLCNYTDVYYNEHISDDMNFMVATASDNEIERFSLRQGDVVITKDSETPDDIAIPAYVEEEPNGVVCGYHLAIIRPDPDLADGQFLTYLFSLPHTRYYFFTLANGATRFGLTTESIRRASFSTPGIDEQKAIAKIIRTADTELSNLRKQRDALREEKKALMQQLLTGKRRVLPSKEA